MKDGDLSYERVPVLIVDYYSLFDEKGEVSPLRFRLLPELHQHFDIKLWIQPSFTHFGKLIKYRASLKDVYELDFVEPIYWTKRIVKVYTRIYRAKVLSARPKIRSFFGKYCMDNWSLEGALNELV